jgi:hypothetical protein
LLFSRQKYLFPVATTAITKILEITVEIPVFHHSITSPYVLCSKSLPALPFHMPSHVKTVRKKLFTKQFSMQLYEKRNNKYYKLLSLSSY